MHPLFAPRMLSIVLFLLTSSGVLMAQFSTFNFSTTGYEPSRYLDDVGLVAPGDFNGDGFLDIAIKDSPSSWSMHSGLDGSFIIQLGTVSIIPTFSWAPCSPGDVNGDGIDDLVYGHNDQIICTSGASNTPLWIASGLGFVDIGGYNYRPDIRALGDADGDGIGDVVIGLVTPRVAQAPFPGLPTYQLPDFATVRSGANGALISNVVGPTVPGQGSNVCPAGDQDGDGLADFAVEHDDLTPPQIHVHRGTDGTLLNVINLPADFASMQGNLDGGHDIDGDGVPDFCVGSPLAGPAFNGAVAAVSSATGTVYGPYFGGSFRAWGARTRFGDHDGNGSADISFAGFGNGTGLSSALLGPAHTGILDATTGALIATDDLNTTGGLPSVPTVTALEDINGDGFADYIMGTYNAGTNVHTVVVSSGVPGFDNSASGNTNGFGPDDLAFRINGSSGGTSRVVLVFQNTPLTFDVLPTGENPGPYDYAIFGFVGAPRPSYRSFIGGTVGFMSFLPVVFNPAGAPVLFTLMTSVTGMPQTVAMTAMGPASLPVPGGIGFPIDLTFQGIVITSPTTYRKTNAVWLRVF